MELNSLLNSIEIPTHQNEYLTNIVDITCNSKKVKSGSLFVAISGFENDGHDYIEDAICNGAVAIIGEKELNIVDVPYIKVPNSRLALSKLASEFYGHPTNGKILIGITGTNGKTTTSFMLKHIFEQAGYICSLFGSVYSIINGEIVKPSSNTTLDALEFNELLANSHDDVVIMEVSSHGISQYRTAGLSFDACLFTNLDQDHLDYHKTMENYFSVKAKLFQQMKPNGIAVINTKDSWGLKLSQRLFENGQEVVRVNGESPDYYILEEEIYNFAKPFEKGVSLQTSLLGEHNIENAALAFVTARAFNIEKSVIEDAFSSFKGVPGRFEQFKHPNGGTVVIDYAHTADAFKKVLQTAKIMGAEKIVHVFGFRGNRDEQKRKHMVEVSESLSDVCILTFDDLNKEKKEKMKSNLKELTNSPQCLVIEDRTLAIQYGWELIQKNDWLIITGKGIEEYKEHFILPSNSDLETVRFLSKDYKKNRSETVKNMATI